MKKIKKALSLLLSISIVFSLFNISILNSNAEAVTTAFIEGTNVNVRMAPSTSASVIEKTNQRSAKVLEKVENAEGIWYKIFYNNGINDITGFIFYNPEWIRIVQYNPDATFEEKLYAFPESYREALRTLHAAYPNWEFIPDNVSMPFNDAVALQSNGMRKQVNLTSQPVSWRSMGLGAYDWNDNKWVQTNGGWTGASREITAYYMDPRNFLDSTYIYTFLQQGFDAAFQTEEGVKKIIAGTFMESNYYDPNDTAYGGSYSKVIMEAARQSGVSPYILASKIKQEIGATETNMVSGQYSGYVGLYNFFNIGASGSSAYETLINGLTRAKAEGWTTRSAAIIGGAKFLSNNYISSGQDTYYLQDFNVHQPDNIWHQYAQAIHDAASKGSSLAKSYRDQTDMVLTFKIPVFTAMPVNASPKPAQSDKRNNYYFESISVSGLTPSFSKFTYNYDLYISGNTVVYVKPVEGAAYAGEVSFNLKQGNNIVALKVRSETGYITDYYINVNAAVDCQLTVESNANAPIPTVKLGDTNNDGKINGRDLANVQMHILQVKALMGDGFIAGDTNSDGIINGRDLANVQMDILGVKRLS